MEVMKAEVERITEDKNIPHSVKLQEFTIVIVGGYGSIKAAVIFIL